MEQVEVVHRAPADGTSLTGCCIRNVWDLPHDDRVTVVGDITCPAPASEYARGFTDGSGAFRQLAALLVTAHAEVDVTRERSLAWLSSILGTRVELNEHGAVELTDEQIGRVKDAVPSPVECVEPYTWTGIPVWRAGASEE